MSTTFQCPFCDKVLATKRNLIFHVRNESGRACRKKTSEEVEEFLSQLSLINCNNKVHKCHYCSKTFSHVPSVYRHEKTHKKKHCIVDSCSTNYNIIHGKRVCVYEDNRGNKCGKYSRGLWYCVAHGGGPRCLHQGEEGRCHKGAVKNTHYCVAHGGGPRCSHVDEQGKCSKGAAGTTNYCIAHGGGRRCEYEDEQGKCNKSAEGTTNYCKAHGGGRRCAYEDEQGKCEKSAQGTTNYCKAHGGGPRCKMCCLFLSEPSSATYRHPETKIGICTAAARNMVIEARTNGDDILADKLKKYFGFKKDLVIRAEHVFYHELVKRVPELANMRRVLDETILAKLLGKRKSLSDPRPDYFHFYDATNMALHGEFDEDEDHEDSVERLRVIAHHAGCGLDRVYIFRVQANLYGRNAVCDRIVRKDIVYYRMTKHGYTVLDKVAAHVKQCVSYMIEGILPIEINHKVVF